MTEDQPGDTLSIPYSECKIADGGVVRVEPGHVIFTHFEKPPLETPGGMLLVEAEDQKYDRVAFGVVAGCGMYVERNLGTIVWNKKDWPLPNNTLICHMYPNPTYVNLPGLRAHFIKADQIVAHWLPGEWPAWAQTVQEWMLKNPELFDTSVISDPQKHRKLLDEKKARDAAQAAENLKRLARR